MPEIDLVAKARMVRQEIFKMVTRTQRGPIPSTFSCVEILVALYYAVKTPEEKVIISKGHAGIAVYPILADLGWLQPNELETFAQPGSRLCMYAEPQVPEITVPCASLGIGFGVAAGLAFADRSKRVFCVLGDAECYEGAVWETAMWVTHQELRNLVVIVDRNGHGVMDQTERCVRQEPVAEKWKAFGWLVEECDGHEMVQLVQRLRVTWPHPKVVIAKTIKAKGLSFWEDQPNIHSAVMTPAQIEQAKKELFDPVVV